MQLIIEKNELLSALTTVRKALSSHNANPTLDGIYIEAHGETLYIMCSDGTLQIESIIHAQVKASGSIVLPGQLFAEIAGKLPDESVEIIQNKGKQSVSIICGGFQMSLQGLPGDEYPEMSTITAPKTIVVQQKKLKDLILQTSFAAATDQTRPILTGLLFEVGQENPEELVIVALSTNRMALCRQFCRFEEAFSAVIPVSSMNKIASIMSDDDKEIRISFGPNNVLFDLESTRVNSALLAGEFLKYKNIIPKQHQTSIYVRRKELQEAIVRASLMARENDKKFVRFSIENDNMVISSNSEMGYVRESIPIRTMGSDLEIAFNAKFMTDILTKLNDEEIILRFQNSEVAGVIQPTQGQGYFYLIAPVQI